MFRTRSIVFSLLMALVLPACDTSDSTFNIEQYFESEESRSLKTENALSEDWINKTIKKSVIWI